MSSAPKLGDVLIHAGALSAAHVEAALRNQVVYGARLGTNLLELGYCEEDTIAQALSRQHNVAAALRKHLDRTDPALKNAIPTDIARRCLAFPVARILGSKKLVVCFRDPTPEMIETVAALGIEVVPAVAAELAVVRSLTRMYNLPAPQRYTRQRGVRAIPAHSREVQVVANPDDDDDIDIDIDFEETGPIHIDDSVAMPAIQLVDLDDAAVSKDTSFYSASDPNISVLAFAKSSEQLHLGEDAASAAAAAGAAAAAAQAAHRATPDMAPIRDAAPEVRLSAEQAVEAIEQAGDRQAVSTALLQFLRSDYSGGLMTMVKGEIAYGVNGFGGHLDDGSADAVMIPLEVESIFHAASSSLETQCIATPPSSSPVQERFLRLFANRPAWLVCAPVILRSRLVSLIYAHTEFEPTTKSLGDLDRVVTAVEAAFLRLIRSARSQQ